MESDVINRIRKAIRDEGVDGWLFYNFRHRDRLADEILGLDPGSTSSRPWVYVVPADNPCQRIVHTIEKEILDSLPGDTVVYSGRDTFISALETLGGRRWGVHLSEILPIISFLDAGSAALMEKAGLILVPADSLVQRLKGLLDQAEVESHKRAAAGLYEIVEKSWVEIQTAWRTGKPIREGDVRVFMLEGMKTRGLTTDHPPIVASGANAGNPHYDFSGTGAVLKPGDIVQLDLWAKENKPDSIYADISWVGVFAEQASPAQERAFSDLIAARDLAIAYITAELEQGRRPTGAAVDAEVRKYLISAGYGGALRHRTGHGIDTECHGSGVNIDSVEFPDKRLLLDGACFSIEPGLYFDDFGLRTEIDVYIQNGKARVSGATPQRTFLSFQR